MSRPSNRFSVDQDSTLKDIWALSHRPSAEFDPQQMRENIQMARQIRQDVRGAGEGLTGLLEGDSPVPRQDDVSRAMKRRSTVNLQKSIALLDEAVGTPIVRTGSNRRTPLTLRHSSYTPQPIPSGSRFDVSSMLGASMIAAPGSMASMNESSQDGQSPMRTRNELSVLADNVTSNVALMLEEDPTIADCTGLYGEFLQTMKNNSAEHQLFVLLGDYERLCQDNVALLKKLSKSTIPGHQKSGRILDTYELLSEEMCTWRLVSALYKDRLETEKADNMMDLGNMGHAESEKQLVDALFERETSVRQAQLVIDWLERNYADTLDDYYDRVEFFMEKSGGAGWENTLHDLQQRASGAGVSSWSGGHMVSQMDPDAPLRQHKDLAPLDTEDEARLIKYLFAHVRAGKLEEAQKLCDRVGQPWRAATLEGWRLYHDPNHCGETEPGERAPVQGNPQRDLWKKCCWKMAEEEKLSMFERALYAAYSGHLGELLPACDSWLDYVWAYLRVYVDQMMEQEVRLNGTRSMQELPHGYMEKMMSIESIFQEIQASPNDVVRMQAKERYHIIQRYVIVGDLDSLIEEMYEWSREDDPRSTTSSSSMPPSPHLLRFMAHLVLFFRTVGSSTKEELCIAILEAYVRHLILTKQTPLIATYVASLPQESQVEWYAKFLESVHESTERRVCLELAEQAGLDLPSITKTVVENIRKQDSADFLGETERNDGTISEEDQEKIDAIEWLVFEPTQRAEAMRQANALMRRFLTLKKLTATKAVFVQLPDDSIQVLTSVWRMQTGGTELSAEDDNTVREYLCVKAYLDAHDSFNDWFEHYQHAKPVKPEIPHGANFTERVAHEHREKQYEAELERWKHSLMLQTETTVDKLYNVLLFPNGGWMVDQRDDGPVDDSRAHQMRHLRQLCLPGLVFLLHTVLHSTEQHNKCLQLADTIASELYGLYLVFRKEELQKLLQKIRESAVALLDKNLDPLGYQTIDMK